MLDLKIKDASWRVMLNNFKPRLYQETIFNTATTKNTLVVLPTGMGKTAIALMMAAHRLNVYPKSKILFLAPTKPLVEQHKKSFEAQCNVEDLVVFTGEIRPEQRKELWKQAKIIFSTPQSVENDIINEKISLKEVSLLVFDEAHRGVGDYAYPFLAKQYLQQAQNARVLGLTASPGGDSQKIEEICTNLHIEAVEVRTDEDPDVAPYIQPVEFNIIKVELPPALQEARNCVDKCIKTKLQTLQKYGGRIPYYSKKELLALQRRIHAQLAHGNNFLLLKCMSVLAEIIKAQHALELIETQGVSAALVYFQRMYEEYPTTKTKAVKNLCEDVDFKTAYLKIQTLADKNLEHPKIPALKEELENTFAANKYAKVILFTQYRDSATKLKKSIKDVPGVLPELFVGQAKKRGTGLSQKEQVAMLDEFKDGCFNVLIATSVAEEGLDIPKVDEVIFYEPVPSAIRTIQRRGRTGRLDKGKVTLLITKGTRDEGYHWSAKGKEKRMKKTLDSMKTIQPKQPTLKEYQKQDVLVHADHREKGSPVIKALIELGVSVRLETLEKCDFVISNKVGIEYKTDQDFVNSIIDGRLLQQLKELRSFERPLVIIEGEDYYTHRGIHPNAVQGMLATIAVSFGIPVLQTKHAKETSKLILAIAKREQTTENKDYSPHSEKPTHSLQGLQEYLVSSLPNVGLTTAKDLLKEFGSAKNVINATKEELQKIEGIGKKISEQIKDVTDKDYS